VTIDAPTLTCAYMLAPWPNYIASPIVESEALVLRTTMLILLSMGAGFLLMMIQLDPSDTVAIARTTMQKGQTIGDLTLVDSIPAGHKVALRDISKGAKVFKYAQSIGTAAVDIPAGTHVHTHNLAFQAVDQTYEFGTNLRAPATPKNQETFMGFDRGDGRIGTRNYIGIITSVNCSATAARMIADHFTPERLAEYPNVDGVTAFVHGTGCGMGGDGTGFEALQR